MTDDSSATPAEPGQEMPANTAGTGIDTTVPHSARIWNYWMGGTDYYPIDKQAGGRVRDLIASPSRSC